MNSLKIFIGDYTYQKEYRSFLVDLLKPLIPEKNLEKYHLSYLPIEIVHNRKKSDYFLLPFSWNYYIETNTINVAKKFITEAQKNKKKILIWVTGDYYYTIPQYNNIIGLYTSPYQSMQNVITIPLPVIIQDPLSILETKKISLSEFKKEPTIGFCGHSDPNYIISSIKMAKLSWQNIKYYMRFTDYYPGSVIPPTYLRKKVLDILDRQNNINTKFIRRNRYQGGVSKKDVYFNKLRKEFYQNIEYTNYTLCIRGGGNFSARFYETLALGRVPIFINTDCMLPFSDKIDWKKHVIWVELRDLPNIKTIILKFHKSLSKESFSKLQKENRKIWENYFMFSGFIFQLISHLNNIKKLFAL